MSMFSPVKLFRGFSAALAMILAGGCAAPKASPAHDQCPAKFAYHYTDSTHGFSLCLPASVTKGDASGFPAGSVPFQGFAVPKGTNLV
jgi:hypothetical protein